MIYFKDKNGDVYAYVSQEEREEHGHKGLVRMSDEEVQAHIKNHSSTPKIDYVTRAQGKAELIKQGLWDDVRTFVESIKDPTERALGFVALDDTTHWQRHSPFLNSVANALELSESDMDDLFAKASVISL